MKLFISFVLGICNGVLLFATLEEFKLTLLNPKYLVESCHSNGLYVEKIVDIKSGKYVLMGYYPSKDRWTIPELVPEYILDSVYVEITCPKGMDKAPYRKKS